ncbi:MAG TPA: pyridoxal phosphate-dependent aminotransferase [Myxococcales bacterium]
MPRIAERVFQLGTETALDVLVKARALEARGRRVIHLEVGEPDFPTPEHVVEAGVRALRGGQTRYGPPAGLPELREALAARLAERGVPAAPGNVVVAPGAKPLIFYGILATIAPGDEALVPDPGFPIYASMVRFCGGTPVALDLDAPQITPRTRLVILNSPSNPTGAIIPEAQLRSLAALCEKHDLWVISDEIYRRIVYGPEPMSIAKLIPERTIVVDGFSKCYAMTGWRLGYGLFPSALAPHAIRLVINSNTCTAAFVQHAGLAALRGPQDAVTAMVAEFRRRRDAIVGALQRTVRCHSPGGAFYAFPDVRALPISAAALADRLLEEEGVAVLDGEGFGAGGAGHLRFSFAASLASLEEAAERFSRLVSRL